MGQLVLIAATGKERVPEPPQRLCLRNRGCGDLFQGHILAPSPGETLALGINPMAAGFAVALLSYCLLLSLFAWTCSLIDARAYETPLR